MASPSPRRRFCFNNDSSDSSDSEATFPPASGVSRNKNNTRRFVLGDPSDQDSSSEYTTAGEDDGDVDVGFERLAISSTQSRATTGTKGEFMSSPSTMSVAEKLCAGGIPHVVNARRDSAGVSSLEQVVLTSDDESHLDTPPPPKREPSLDYISEALVDIDTGEDDDGDDDDSRSTVVQEGRTKTPKRKSPQMDYKMGDDDESEPLVDKTQSFLHNNVGDGNSDYNSEPLVDDTQGVARTMLQVETPSKRDFSFDEESQELVDSSQDDTTTFSYVKTPVKRESSIYQESQALVDSSHDDMQVPTPQRDPSLYKESQALVDSSPDDDTTVLQIATPKQEPSLCEESQALVDSSPDDTQVATPQREPSLYEESQALVDSSPDDDTTVLHIATPKQEPSLCDEAQPFVDSSPDDTTTVLNAETPMKQEPSSSGHSGALVDSSPDDNSTVFNLPAPVKQEPLSSSNDSRDDSKSTIYPPETPWKDVNQSVDANKEDSLDYFTAPTNKVSRVSAPKDVSCTRQRSDSLFDSGSDESDSSTLYPAESPECESPLDGTSSMLADINFDDTSRCFEEDDAGQQETDTAWQGKDSEDGKPFSDTSPFEQKNKKMVFQDNRTNKEVFHGGTSSRREDLNSVGPRRRKRETLVGVGADEMVDTSSEEDDTLTVVQEGRFRTPKRTFARDDNSDSDSLSDSRDEVSELVFDEKHDDCAWDLKLESREVFLSDDKFSMLEVSWPKLLLPLELFKRLYSHQKAGVQWLAGLHNLSIGGILGDDMGMGKTYQSVAFLGGLMRAHTIRNALVVAPLSVLQSWEKEARLVMKKYCVPRITIIVLSSDVAKNRRRKLLQEALSCSAKSPYLIITTYGLITSSPLDFTHQKKCWGYVVLDEGHKIKNPSAQVSKACEQICSNPRTRRLVLTGTLIQNNLKELWAVVNWATSGRLFGPLPKFKNEFSIPIEEGRHKNASENAMRRADLANNALQERLRPHYLQRLKKDFMQNELPEKTELVVWTHISTKQRNDYERYLRGDQVLDVLRGKVKSPLEAITWLKKLCGHPLLVEIPTSGQYDRSIHVDSRKIQDLLAESAKLQVIVSLLEQLRKKGHKTLIFSQSTRMLDILDHVLYKFRLSRIDGSTKGKDRQSLVDAFNDEDSEFDAMLLSTKATGLGLTLTGADRVIVYDPSWNPAEDAQAIDRAYRIGQRQAVTVYRLISAGTVEEKMYEKQVHKDGIRRAVTTSAGNATERFFDKKDLRRLFELGEAGKCDVLEKIHHANQRKGLGSKSKSSFLKSHPGVVGVSSHDDIYLVTEKSAQEEIGTPFGGTAISAAKSPEVLGKAARVLAKGRRLEYSTIDSKENLTDNASATTKRGGSTLDNAINVDVNSDKDGDAVPTKAEIETLLATVDTLRERGDDISAMSILVELMKKKSAVKGDQKLQMHKGLAELGRSLGWLYNDNTSV